MEERGVLMIVEVMYRVIGIFIFLPGEFVRDFYIKKEGSVRP
jgi:hypothetical protein